MWELYCEEGWVPKNRWFWTVVLEKTLESSLDCKEIQPVHSEGDQPWDFFGRNDAKAETPVLWPPHVKCWLIGKDSDSVRYWGQEEEGKTEDEMAGWHDWLDGRWVWVNSRSWWWTGRPGVLRFMGSHRVGHDWATELNWLNWIELVGKVISLLYNMLSRLLITFLPRSKRLLISWLQSPSAVILELPQNKVSHCFHCFPIYLPWSDGTGCHDLHFSFVVL